MKKIYILVVLLAIVIGTISFWMYLKFRKMNVDVACTMEARLCPDGSYVGRSGPNCEFISCPTSLPQATSSDPIVKNSKGYLIGQITLGPTCPVERNPPDPNCTPKAYSTLITISGAHNFFIELHTDADGIFRTPLPVGTYTIMTHQTTIFPRCDSKEVTIIANATTTADISCDTGIR